MQQILVYSDSASWGIVPTTRERLAFDARWPGVMEIALAEQGHRVRVIEDCLNGRRTVWEDPFKPGRNGLAGLAQRIEVNSPLALVMLMLGNNDFQSMHPHTAWHAAQGIATLVAAIRQAPIEPGMAIPPILVIAPPPILIPRGPIAAKFTGIITIPRPGHNHHQETGRNASNPHPDSRTRPARPNWRAVRHTPRGSGQPDPHSHT